MGPIENRCLRLGYPESGEFYLFSDGFFLQSVEHPDVFAFHWTPSSLGAKSLQRNPAQVDIGPEVNNPTLEAVSPDYLVIVWDDLS